MNNWKYDIIRKKIIVKITNRVCEDSEELLSSSLFYEVLRKCVEELSLKDSPLLEIFPDSKNIMNEDIEKLIMVFQLLSKIPIDFIEKLIPDSHSIIKDTALLSKFIEYLYDYWRDFDRFIICDSKYDSLNKRPYRTFNNTIETLMHLIRKVYRDIEENITGNHPRIFRQVRSGAEIAAIALPVPVIKNNCIYNNLNDIPLIRQILLYPPLILNPPMNKRSGIFTESEKNPFNNIDMNKNDWICYPAKVGELLILVYFHKKFYELGFSLCNLFELADDDFLKQKPDAIYFFGVSESTFSDDASKTIYHYDKINDVLIAAVPNSDQYGYFGYLKKMILTLYNIKMMKNNRLPYHGAMVEITLNNNKKAVILIIGDTGTGKSETLEALRITGKDLIKDIVIIADDMGSLNIDKEDAVIGYGTEIGAFVRLDDLQPGYAFGQLDRAIIMNANQVNARVVLPVTTYENIIKGYNVNIILYANNYEKVSEKSPAIEKFESVEKALEVFRTGAAMSKGTTTSTGITATYFVNVFGAVQNREIHDIIAERYFKHFFKNNIYTGQIRTQLGIPGKEHTGPEETAGELLKLIDKI